MNYISLEINKDGKNVEILLGGTVLEGSDMQGGIRLLITNGHEDVAEKDTVHQVEAVRCNPPALCPSGFAHDNAKPTNETSKRTPKKRSMPAESRYLFGKSVKTIIVNMKRDTGKSALTIAKELTKYTEYSSSTLYTMLNKTVPAPIEVASALGTIIGAKLGVVEERWEVLEVLTTQESEPNHDEIKFSIGVVKQIKEYRNAMGMDESAFYKKISLMSGISESEVEEAVMCTTGASETLIKALSEVLQVKIISIALSGGERLWTIC